MVLEKKTKKRISGDVGVDKKKKVTKEPAPSSLPSKAPEAGMSEGLKAVLSQHSINKLDEALAGRALDALLKFTARQQASRPKRELLGEGEGDKIHLQFTLKRVPGADQQSPKPMPLSVPHPIRGPGGDCEMCLFVKKDDKPWVKELLLEGPARVPGMAKVITLDKLRTSYARFEQRRDLLATYDLFLADDAILPMLCKTLGKTFFSRKKQPVPVRVARKSSLPHAIGKVRDSTFMFLGAGTCVSVCVGTTAMSRDELLANVAAVVPAAVDKLPRKWKNLQAISLKTTTSQSLPILNKLPFTLLPGAVESDDEAEDEKAAPAVSGGGVSATKKAKAAAVEETATPKKKRGAFERKSFNATPTSSSKKGVISRSSTAKKSPAPKARSPSPAATRAKPSAKKQKT